MTMSQPTRNARLHQYGPWALVGVVTIALIAYESGKHHIFTRFSLLFFLILVPTIILHEVSHGVVAHWCGDDTAKEAGRLTLNPIKHIDIFGTILLPILLIVTTGSAFGWAKPVPVSINRLRHPRNQAVLVGLAGPAVNLVIALISGLVLRVITHDGTTFFNIMGGYSSWVVEVLFVIGITNVFIAVFNLIPIPPLDGSAVVERFLPQSALAQYYRIRQYSMFFILFIVLFEPNALDALFNHATTIWESAIIT